MVNQNIQASPIIQIPRIFESLALHLNLLGPNYLHLSKQNSRKVFPTTSKISSCQNSVVITKAQENPNVFAFGTFGSLMAILGFEPGRLGKYPDGTEI